MRNPTDPAGIEYHGQPGSTDDCFRAVERILQTSRPIQKVVVVTARTPPTASHGMLLINDLGDQVAVKSGFASGYGGSGPFWFSFALALLDLHSVEIEEVDVPREFLDRIDASALTVADIEWFQVARSVRPKRIYDYIQEQHAPLFKQPKNLWSRREAQIPWALIDDRLIDLALVFWSDPDVALFKAHRRLEEIVRDRTGLGVEEASKLGPSKVFASAFNGDDPKLTWPGVTGGERQGRANLFVGAVQAHRNVRAHREIEDGAHDQLSEFLFVNHLYRLESVAVSVAPKFEE